MFLGYFDNWERENMNLDVFVKTLENASWVTRSLTLVLFQQHGKESWINFCDY